MKCFAYLHWGFPTSVGKSKAVRKRPMLSRDTQIREMRITSLFFYKNPLISFWYLLFLNSE